MSNDKYILDGQTMLPGFIEKLEEFSASPLVVLNNPDLRAEEDMMPKTKEAAIDYLNEIGWLQEHDKILSPKEGNWIKSDKYNGYSVCSVCGDCYVDSTWISSGKWLFCPSCGARMIYEENIKKHDFTNHSCQLTSSDCCKTKEKNIR